MPSIHPFEKKKLLFNEQTDIEFPRAFPISLSVHWQKDAHTNKPLTGRKIDKDRKRQVK